MAEGNDNASEEDWYDARTDSPTREQNENFDAMLSFLTSEEEENDHFCPDRVDPDFIEREATRLYGTLNERKNITIFLFGKAGSGKSSLGKSIVGIEAEDAPREVSGWVSCKTEETHFSTTVGNVDVTVVDTRGLCDGLEDAKDYETVRLMGDVLYNDRSGVIIICLEFHQRMDESTLKPMVFLHRQFGREIWPHVIIALTKADRYEEDKWLESRPRGKSKAEYLVCRFHKEVDICKRHLQTIFTSEEMKPRYRIGMTEREFEELQVPVIPTSQLRRTEIRKMTKVGHDYWFDELLLHCCARDRDVGIIQIHPERMTNIPSEVLRKVDEALAKSAYAFVEWARKKRIEPGLLKYAAVLVWSCYWRSYYKKLIASPRFQATTPACTNPAT